MSLRAAPITADNANRFVEAFHRHNGALRTVRFAVAAIDDGGTVRGVAIAGQWRARPFDSGTLEVSRVCTDGTANACSFLYARCVRAAKALGYVQLVTYTQANEDGASLKASGWKSEGLTESLRRATHQRSASGSMRGGRVRWRIVLADPLPQIVWPDGVVSAEYPSLFEWGKTVA